MGLIRISSLLPEDDGDDSHEIGAMPVRQPWRAMRVGHDAGRLVYQGEIEIDVALRWRVVDYGPATHRWWRLEAKVAKVPKLQAGSAWMLAEHPHSSCWHDFARFKPPNHKGEDERPSPAAQEFPSPVEFLEWLEGLDHDFWEKGKLLTAGISLPRAPTADPEDVRQNTDAVYALGVCDDFVAYREELLRTPEVAQLLAWTANNTIQFVWPGVGDVQLYPDVIESAETIMLLSIGQALAGPWENSDAIVGRPVTEAINDVYREHLNRCNRQEATRQRYLAAIRNHVEQINASIRRARRER